MDLKVQTVVVMLMMAALSFFIYVFMIPAQMVGSQLDETVLELAARIENTVGATTAQFNNNTEIPGTAVRTLLNDASANNLSIFIQTRAGQGLVVNYGPQLRNPVTNRLTIAAGGTTRNTKITDFERNFVITAHDLFAVNGATATRLPAPREDEMTIKRTIANDWNQPDRMVMGTQSMPIEGKTLQPILVGLLASNNAVLAYRSLIGANDPNAASIDGSEWSDPVLFFWDVTLPSSTQAANMGKSYSNTGILYAPGVRRTNLPLNTNLSFAQQQGSPFFVNPTALFHSTFILDTTGAIIGIYLEEHAVDARVAYLAAAQQEEGFIAQAIQFAGLPLN
ncbi:MAG: hypothetical protein FWE27_04945 [Defluviitaleaceae bacterium]|nr:hypothetical protein [Defluviitaleaceae bacterium]